MRNDGLIGARAMSVGAALAVLAALFVVPTAGSAIGRSGTTNQMPKVTVGIIAVDPSGQAMYAKARGMFAKHGLDVEVKKFADGTQVGQALGRGEIQFAGMPPPTLAQRKAVGLPIRAVAGGAIYRPGVPTTRVVASPRSTIRRARDLVGKQINVDFETSIAHI